MNNKKLKQPHKYTHDVIQRDNEAVEFDQQAQIKGDKDKLKTKKIEKLRHKNLDKKKINKKFEPSAQRLEAINQTFHKIQLNSEDMLAEFNFNRQYFKNLLSYSQKVKCTCGRNIKYYCLKCLSKNPEIQLPKVKLPFKTVIIHHFLEKINKSSIAPMLFLSDQLSLINFNQQKNKEKKEEIQNKVVPKIQLGYQLNEQNKKNTYILFPHKNSQKVTKQMADNIQNLIVLDCTWFQTDSIVNQLQTMGLNQYIRLDDYQSLFWRYNHHNDRALSSAEAVAYFLRQYQTVLGHDKKTYDDMMLLYCLNLKIIGDSYTKQSKPVEQQQ